MDTPLALRCLALGDDALILSQRVAEWCSRAPELEEDIALANIALDLLGQARLLLARAAEADPSLVPTGTSAPPEDALAFFRDAKDFHSTRLAAVPNGDFAHVVVRLLLFSTARLATLNTLRAHHDPALAAIAEKGVKELAYHRDWSARWFVTLAQGTEESRRRTLTALHQLWPLRDTPLPEVDTVIDQVLAAAGINRPRNTAPTEADHLTALLADMQSVARAHPQAQW